MPTSSKKLVHRCPVLTSIYSLFNQRSFRGRVKFYQVRQVIAFCFNPLNLKRAKVYRLLIGFSDVLGWEITEDSIVLDLKSLPKLQRKVTCELCRHSATQSSIIEVDVNQKSSGKWTEQCILASDKWPYRITVGLMRQRELKFRQLKDLLLKIPPLKRAADGGLQATYSRSSQVHGNPEERYPVLKDPTLVRAG